MATIKCFMIEPTDRVRRWLRRYHGIDKERGSPCPINGHIHDAMVQIEDGPVGWDKDHRGYFTSPERWPHDDARWPTQCACGYVFQEADRWQIFYQLLYRRPETGDEYHLHPNIEGQAPPGAMFYSDWLSFKGSDGRSLSVITPAGQWDIDHPPAGGTKGWDRTGEPPNVTATPSIHFVGSYHGWLKNGQLVEA